MVKSVIITLTGDIPETALNQAGKIVIGTDEYPGTVTAIVVHTPPALPASTQITIEGTGLKVA